MSEVQRQLGTRSAAPVTIPTALAGLALGAMILAGAEGPARSALAVLLLLGGGVGLGPLLLLTPVEPAPLKLWLFSSLLGLPLVGGGFALASGVFGAEAQVAWALPFGLCGLMCAAASGRRLGTAPPGRAALGAILLGGIAAVGGWALLASTSGVIASLTEPATVAHLTLSDAAVGGADTPNPWFFGGALDLRPAVGIAMAALAAPGDLSVVEVLPLLGGWSLLVLTLVGYLASAAAFREQRAERAAGRDLLAAALCLSAAGLHPLWEALSQGGASPEPLGLEVDPAALLARVYWSAALLAGLHAVRRGARPWPGLAAFLTGAGALAQPWVGPSLVFAVAIPAAIARRSFLIPMMLGACLPAFWVGRAYGGFTLDQVTSVGLPVGATDAGVYLLLVPALLVSRRWVRLERVSGPGLYLLLAAALIPQALPGVAAPAAWERDALDGLTLIPLALLAARGLGTLGGKGLAVGAGLAIVGCVGLWRPAMFVHSDDVAEAALPFTFGTSGLQLTSDPELAEGLGDALREARKISAEVAGPVALLRGGAARPGVGKSPSLAPLLTGASLWVDDAAPPGTLQPRFGSARKSASGATALGDEWVDRRDLRDALFRDRNAWHPRFDRVLRAEVERGTTLLLVVTEEDRRRTTDRGTGPRGPDMVFLRLGAERIFEAPGAALYRLPPAGD